MAASQSNQHGGEITPKYLFTADSSPSAYAFHQGYILTNTPVQSSTDFNERLTNAYMVPEMVQILRYLAHCTYADLDTIIKMANLYRRKGLFPNVVVEPAWIKKQLDKCVYIGLVNRRTFIDEIEYRTITNKGQITRINLATPDKLTCYCLTDRGAGYFKRQTQATFFIEEMLFEISQVEVLRRLAVNYVCMDAAYNLGKLGEVFYCESVRNEAVKARHPLYGRLLRNDKKEMVIYEPIFLYRDNLIQEPAELESHFEERVAFLKGYISEFKDKNPDTKVTICLVFSNSKSDIRPGVTRYYGVLKEADAVIATSEPLVRTLSGRKEPAPYFRLDITPKADGTLGISVFQTEPTIFASEV